MKTKLLTAAIATASIMTSGVASADGHANSAINTAIENTVFTGSVFSAYRMIDSDTNGDTSDWDLDAIRFGFSTTIKEDTQLNVELGYSPGDKVDAFDTVGTLEDADDAGFRLVSVRDLNLAKKIGNTTITAGRLRTIADRNDAAADEDSLFNSSLQGVALNTAPIIDGIEIKSYNDTGLHGSAAAFKGGLDTTGGDSERDLGFNISAGWIGGNDDLSFGITLAYSDIDGGESDVALGTAGTGEENESDGYSVSTFIAAGPVTATLAYSDRESESSDTVVDALGVVTGTSSSDTETDGYGLQVAYDLGGAGRGFDHYGVWQGPTIAKGQTAYEVVFSYGMRNSEIKNGATGSELPADAGSDTDTDSFGLGINAYCGPHTKWFLEYTTSENDPDMGVKTDTDVIAFGARLDW